MTEHLSEILEEVGDETMSAEDWVRLIDKGKADFAAQEAETEQRVMAFYNVLPIAGDTLTDSDLDVLVSIISVHDDRLGTVLDKIAAALLGKNVGGICGRN